MESSCVIDSPVGRLKIRCRGEQLLQVHLSCEAALSEPQSHFESQVCTQLQDYFHDCRVEFNIPIVTQGSAFQRRVWKALCEIPVGQVMTYGQLASQLNSSARAIGNACRHNPTPIVVPCHRVVAQNSLGGFAGEVSGRLMTIKQNLLAHEGFVVTANLELPF